MTLLKLSDSKISTSYIKKSYLKNITYIFNHYPSYKNCFSI